jgi:hypothetical protein
MVGDCLVASMGSAYPCIGRVHQGGSISIGQSAAGSEAGCK